MQNLFRICFPTIWEIYCNFKEAIGDRTAIYISHRLSSTRFCDRILLIEHGAIVEEGTHETLMAKNGRYAELYEMQSKYYKEESEHARRLRRKEGLKMSKQEQKAYFYLLKELMRDCPTVLLSAFFDGAILGARPFIAVYLTGLLIDAVYAGESPKRKAFYALLGTGIVLIISAIESFVVKHLNQNMEYMYERQDLFPEKACRWILSIWRMLRFMK